MSPNSNSKDPLFILIENTNHKVEEYHRLTRDDLKEIKEDIRDIKKSLSTDIENLDIQFAKLSDQQQKCNSYWSLIGKTLSWGGLGSVVTAFLYKVFGASHNQ